MITPRTQLMNTFWNSHAFKSINSTWKLCGRRYSSLKSFTVVPFSRVRQQSAVHLSNSAINHSNQWRAIKVRCHNVINELLMSSDVCQNVAFDSTDSVIFGSFLGRNRKCWDENFNENHCKLHCWNTCRGFVDKILQIHCRIKVQ